jgi:hypothetical protein
MVGGERHVFDSFECAIHAVAPRCEHCECRIIAHGIGAGDALYCGAHTGDRCGWRSPHIARFGGNAHPYAEAATSQLLITRTDAGPSGCGHVTPARP